MVSEPDKEIHSDATTARAECETQIMDKGNKMLRLFFNFDFSRNDRNCRHDQRWHWEMIRLRIGCQIFVPASGMGEGMVRVFTRSSWIWRGCSSR